MRIAGGRRVIAGSLTLLALLGLSVFAYWWTHPTRFQGAGAAEGYTLPVHIGNPGITVGVLGPYTSGDGSPVRIRSASIHLGPNSAQAVATFRICTGQGIGLVVDPARYCRTLEGLPASLNLQAGSGQSLIMTVTPTSVGQVTVDSITVDYRQDGSELWQQGSQSIPLTLTFPARR